VKRSILAVNMFTAFVTLGFVIHIVACLWYTVACPDDTCRNDDMKETIEQNNSKS